MDFARNLTMNIAVAFAASYLGFRLSNSDRLPRFSANVSTFSKVGL